MNVEIFQGDSHSQKWTCRKYPTFDGNWSGVWAIVPSAGKPPVASGVLVRAADSKSLDQEIPPSATNGVPTGSYLLVTEIRNASLSFNKEIHQRFTIRTQGI